jgi:hypothetical protein
MCLHADAGEDERPHHMAQALTDTAFTLGSVSQVIAM